MVEPVTFFYGRRLATKFRLSPEDSHHAVRVLRFHPGDELWCIDGSGSAYAVELEVANPRAAVGTIVREHPHWNEPACELYLLCGMAQAGRMDWLVEKSTELGVHHVLPIQGRFKPGPGRKRRWSRIARSAAKQCRRGRIPAIAEPAPLESLLDLLPESGRRFVAEISGTSPPAVVAPAGSLTLAVGHDEGFSSGERDLLVKAGFQPLSLGPRRLRTETAVLAALAVLEPKARGGARREQVSDRASRSEIA